METILLIINLKLYSTCKPNKNGKFLQLQIQKKMCYSLTIILPTSNWVNCRNQLTNLCIRINQSMQKYARVRSTSSTSSIKLDSSKLTAKLSVKNCSWGKWTDCLKRKIISIGSCPSFISTTRRRKMRKSRWCQARLNIFNCWKAYGGKRVIEIMKEHWTTLKSWTSWWVRSSAISSH